MVFKKLGVRIIKVSAQGDPIKTSMRQIEKQKPDLVVLATGGRRGLPLWLKPSVAQAVRPSDECDDALRAPRLPRHRLA